MDEAFKPLMTFTLGLLRFYKCDCMPFSLVNAPATFQRLMEAFLGDLSSSGVSSISVTSLYFSKDQKII